MYQKIDGVPKNKIQKLIKIKILVHYVVNIHGLNYQNMECANYFYKNYIIRVRRFLTEIQEFISCI